MMWRALALVVGILALGTACGSAVAGAPSPAPAAAPPSATSDAAVEDQLRQLEADEAALRASTDWERFPASDTTLGPDPIDILPLPDGRFAGALRGANAVVLLDPAGRELARASAPRGPRSLAPATGGFAVASDAPPNAQRFRVAADEIGAGAVSPVDEAVAPFARAAPGGWRATLDVLGHAVRVTRRGREVATLSSDGPPLGFTLRAAGDALLVAVGLVEDHPLDRSIGSFGHIDSFLRVFRVTNDGALRLLELNLSEVGVVTPKALAFLDDDQVLVAGAGSGRAVKVRVSSGAGAMVPSLPGVVALVPTKDGFIGASPLLDAWVVVDARGARAVAVPDSADDAAARRSSLSRLGEALVFTTVMAPRQKSDGPLSRFTCETCHFEGGVDGRTHHTGRGDVRATTRPLLGLFNNKPLFTRALDPNLSRMAHAEFRVANANSTLAPWFPLTLADAPWLALLGVEGTQEPADLRRALVAFLRDFTPRANPRVVERLAASAEPRFTPIEKRGAEVFRARCATCHAARLVGDDPSTEQPFERWESLVLSPNGPLVWSSAERRRTGIVPLVHPEGARSSSLRRLEQKRPYFTNGAAKTLSDVVRGFVPPDQHQAATGEHLSAEEQTALLAFLVLL